MLDFDSFVASSRGISSGEAEKLIADWMREYRPRARNAFVEHEEPQRLAG